LKPLLQEAGDHRHDGHHLGGRHRQQRNHR
jgi:hypothetical protein